MLYAAIAGIAFLQLMTTGAVFYSVGILEKRLSAAQAALMYVQGESRAGNALQEEANPSRTVNYRPTKRPAPYGLRGNR